jgi:hypothetical protein
MKWRKKPISTFIRSLVRPPPRLRASPGRDRFRALDRIKSPPSHPPPSATSRLSLGPYLTPPSIPPPPTTFSTQTLTLWPPTSPPRACRRRYPDARPPARPSPSFVCRPTRSILRSIPPSRPVTVSRGHHHLPWIAAVLP